jgi:hypothetical protein
MSESPPSPPRRRGRPALDESDRDTVVVHVRLPTRQYDAACQRATSERVTVPELLRRALRREP